ncbi:G-type lectin S-receptor-like serine/threonine-protein kinase At1g34300 [Euphorbia peplus]|nr:G-type lectin S-receptor-like serine/threonine-protein kinase At1g34300 [Euphorbia peplus]
MKTHTSSPPNLFLIIIFILTTFSTSTFSHPKNILPKGSSLSPQNNDTLISPHKTFTCGFYGTSTQNALWFSIWFTQSTQKTIVWSANRSKPINKKASKMSLHSNGALVLTDFDGSIVWQTNTTSTDANTAELLDSGNFVLKNPYGKIIWQSFDFPTHTLLPNQFFTKSSKLYSNLGKGSFDFGYYSLFFDNNNALTLMYDGPEISSIYWPDPDLGIFGSGRTTYNSSRIAVFDELGEFSSSDELKFRACDFDFGVKRRLTLDYDGNLRVYSLNRAGFWIVTWEAMLQMCKVHGVCGRNGVCVFTTEPKCSCPPGYKVKDSGDWSKGCKPEFHQLSLHRKRVQFVELQHVDFYGFDLSYTESISMDSCLNLCLNDSRCSAFSYRLDGDGLCYTKSALFNGYWSPNFPGSIYLKLPASLNKSESLHLNARYPECSSTPTSVMIGSSSMYDSVNRMTKWTYLYLFATVIGSIELVCVVLVWWFLFRSSGVEDPGKEGYQALSSQFRKFSYLELKKATRNFKEELGRGASSVVYKGVLRDNREVAVKKLGQSYQGEEFFWAEMSTVCKLYHMNLIRTWGFCSERNYRLLVYEYLECKSLDKHLFSNPNFLGWKERFKVALGTAKGLAYLHHECLEWVIHCDVKPENILLDADFEPKISDFGLSKLTQRGGGNSEFSQIRGTKGYMAPEWGLNQPITAKVDVYSYGVVILELVKGIRLSNMVVEDGEEVESELTRFVRVVKRDIKCEEEGFYSWIEEIVDPRLKGEFRREEAVKLVKIGISCVEEDRNERPTMDSVVLSLLECQEDAQNREFNLNRLDCLGPPRPSKSDL